MAVETLTGCESTEGLFNLQPDQRLVIRQDELCTLLTRVHHSEILFFLHFLCCHKVRYITYILHDFNSFMSKKAPILKITKNKNQNTHNKFILNNKKNILI